MIAAPRVFVGATHLAPGLGGIARVARMTARTLIEGGAEVKLLSLLDDEAVSVAGIDASLARSSRARFLLRSHAMGLFSDRAVYDSVGTARAHARLGALRRPYAVWIHGVEVWYANSPARRQALERADLVLVNSAFTLERYREIHGSADLPARVCWLATEDDEPPEAMSIFSGPPRALMVGRIDKDEGYKGHQELVAAWPEVVAAVPDARLGIVGSGSGLAALRDQARQSPAAGSIDVHGFVAEHDMPALWRNAHAFVMPSRNEGFGIVYAEAMRYGLPVVASVHDAGREVNVDGVTGYNVDLDRPDDLSERLVHLLSDTDRARAMGAASHLRWQANFRYGAFASRLGKSLGGFVELPRSV